MLSLKFWVLLEILKHLSEYLIRSRLYHVTEARHQSEGVSQQSIEWNVESLSMSDQVSDCSLRVIVCWCC